MSGLSVTEVRFSVDKRPFTRGKLFSFAFA
jgi:hypothetical protein